MNFAPPPDPQGIKILICPGATQRKLGFYKTISGVLFIFLSGRDDPGVASQTLRLRSTSGRDWFGEESVV